jgi:integrase
MPRPRKGSIVERKVKVKGKNGKIKTRIEIYARVTYMDGGKRKDIWKRAKNRTHANELNKETLKDLDEKGAGFVEASKMTFSQLADYYKKNYIVEPTYVEGRKIAGMRSYKIASLFLQHLQNHFDKYRIKNITYGEIEKYKIMRLTGNTNRGNQRKISSVHRELQLLRRLLNVAVREGWLNRNPFNAGDALINVADERKRKRVLSLDEEYRLLAACEDPRREHLSAIIIAALDTGMRKNEILQLGWSDVDFVKRIITVQAFNTKTMNERQIAITSRLEAELKNLWEKSRWIRELVEKGITLEPQLERAHKMVFSVGDIKHSFTTACRKAGVNDLVFHDLRRTFNTRLAPHMAQTEIMRLTGHTQVQTNFRYVGVEENMLYRAASILEEIQAKNHLNGLEERIN